MTRQVSPTRFLRNFKFPIKIMQIAVILYTARHKSGVTSPYSGIFIFSACLRALYSRQRRNSPTSDLRRNRLMRLESRDKMISPSGSIQIPSTGKKLKIPPTTRPPPRTLRSQTDCGRGIVFPNSLIRCAPFPALSDDGCCAPLSLSLSGFSKMPALFLFHRDRYQVFYIRNIFAEKYPR